MDVMSRTKVFKGDNVVTVFQFPNERHNVSIMIQHMDLLGDKFGLNLVALDCIPIENLVKVENFTLLNSGKLLIFGVTKEVDEGDTFYDEDGIYDEAVTYNLVEIIVDITTTDFKLESLNTIIDQQDDIEFHDLKDLSHEDHIAVYSISGNGVASPGTYLSYYHKDDIVSSDLITEKYAKLKMANVVNTEDHGCTLFFTSEGEEHAYSYLLDELSLPTTDNIIEEELEELFVLEE